MICGVCGKDMDEKEDGEYGYDGCESDDWFQEDEISHYLNR